MLIKLQEINAAEENRTTAALKEVNKKESLKFRFILLLTAGKCRLLESEIEIIAENQDYVLELSGDGRPEGIFQQTCFCIGNQS